MTETSVPEAILAELRHLGQSRQREVLDCARRLQRPTAVGVRGAMLRRFAGFIPPSDLNQMARAISLDCGQVDPRDW